MSLGARPRAVHKDLSKASAGPWSSSSTQHTLGSQTSNRLSNVASSDHLHNVRASLVTLLILFLLHPHGAGATHPSVPSMWLLTFLLPGLVFATFLQVGLYTRRKASKRNSRPFMEDGRKCQGGMKSSNTEAIYLATLCFRFLK